MDLLPETWRRMQAESQRMVAQLIEQCRASCQSASKDKTGLYEFNIAHLPGEVLKKFGDVIIVRDSEAVDLNYWTLSELQSLHQELEKGTVHVKLRDEKNSARFRPLHEELSHSQRQLQGGTIQIDIRDGSPRPIEEHAIRATPPVKRTRKSKGNACTNCKAQKTGCVGKLPCLRCVEKNCAATCTYPGSSGLQHREGDEYLWSEWSLSDGGKQVEQDERGSVHTSGARDRFPRIHHSLDVDSRVEHAVTESRPNIDRETIPVESRERREEQPTRIMRRAILHRLRNQLKTLLGEPCENIPASQVIGSRTPGQSRIYDTEHLRWKHWRWEFRQSCPLSAFPEHHIRQWNINECHAIAAALDANQIAAINIDPADRSIAIQVDELNRQSQEGRKNAQHTLLLLLKDRLATLLGESCATMSAAAVLNSTTLSQAENDRGQNYKPSPWRWQFHMDCPISSLPKSKFWNWSGSMYQSMIAALEADQMSVTLIDLTYTPDTPTSTSQVPPASSLQDHQTDNTVISDYPQDSADIDVDGNTDCSIDPSLLHQSQTFAQPEELMTEDVHQTKALGISCLEEKVRDAETIAGSKLLQVTGLENDLRAAKSQATKYLADLSVAKAEIRSAHIKIEDLRSHLENSAKDSAAQIETLQNQVDDANETSRKLHVWLANGNTAQQTELKQAKDHASAQSAKVSNLETQLKNTRILQDSENLLQLSNARTKSELTPSSILLLELKNVKNDLAEQMHVSTNFEERLQASQKEYELRGIMMDKFYEQQKTDRQTIEDLQQAEKDLKVQLASLQKTSQKTIRDLQQAQRDLVERSVSEERKSRKVVKDLEQALEELKIQLAASEETAAGHLRDVEIEMANVKKAEGIQRRLKKQAAVAKASGVSAGKRSALSVMEKQQTIMLQAHSKQLEEARYEAIEIGRASALEESKVGLDQARIDALVSIHKSWDGIPPELLPNPGDLSTKAIVLLEVLSGNTDSLTAYKLLREAIQQRYKSTAASDKNSFVTSQDVQSVLARHSFAPASRKNVNMPSPRSNSSAKSSVRPTVEADVLVFRNRSRSCSTEIDDDEFRALIVQQMLSDFSNPTSQKQPTPANNGFVVRPSKCPIPICLDSGDDCTIVDKPASPKRPLTNTDSVERSPKRLKSIFPDSASDDDCTIVVDVSRLEHDKERRLREEKLMELARRRRKCRKQKSKTTSSTAPKSRSKSTKARERPCPSFPNLNLGRRMRE